jgi:hypothetical protein
MKTLRLAWASLALLATTVRAEAADWRESLFQRLASHPAFETKIYDEQTLIMERSGTFYAAIAVVRSDESPLVCAYAAPFDPGIGAQPGAYVLRLRYVCDTDKKLKPYIGYFELKYPWCGGQVCANPAIGVGNLDILPDYELPLISLPLDRLPKLLPVTVTGRFDFQYDASLPVAGRPFPTNP